MVGLEMRQRHGGAGFVGDVLDESRDGLGASYRGLLLVYELELSSRRLVVLAKGQERFHVVFIVEEPRARGSISAHIDLIQDIFEAVAERQGADVRAVRIRGPADT